MALSLITVVRILFVVQLLYTSVVFSLRTLVSALAVVVVFYVTQDWDSLPVDLKRPKRSVPPPKLSMAKTDSTVYEDGKEIPADVVHHYEHIIAESAVSDDPAAAAVLERFSPVQRNTHCLFAQRARLWGCADWDSRLSLGEKISKELQKKIKEAEENIQKSIPALTKFLAIGFYCQLDGFVFELPAKFGVSVERFGDGVRQLLTCLSEADPGGVHCMRKSYVGGVGWYFEFNRTSIFVTTFAPCYPENHSRYTFGGRSCFVLLQPEYSFALKDLNEDTPHTNWDDPKTVRDRIRVAYRQHGREYLVRDTVYYPPAWDIVKPLIFDGPVVEWWKVPKKTV